MQLDLCDCFSSAVDCQSDCTSKCTYFFMSKQTRFFDIITYAQIPLFNNIADVFNESRSLHPSLRLHQHPYSILWSFEHKMRRRVCAFVQTRRSLHCSMV